MKIYIDSNIININLLKDLKNKFDVVFEDNKDVKVKLRNNILTFYDIDVDCSHWIEKIEEGNLKLSLSDLIDRMLIEYSSSLDIIL